MWCHNRLRTALVSAVAGLALTAIPLHGQFALPVLGARENSPSPRTATATSSLFRYLGSVQVTPDATFRVGSFPRINYVPATDRFLLTFGTVAAKQSGTCQGAGYAYKEYTVDMQATGKAGYFVSYKNACSAGDSGSTMVGNSYYGAFVSQDPGQPYGWRLLKMDGVSFAVTAERFVLLDEPNQGDLDPTVAWVNGQLDVSDQYNPTGIWQDGAQIHHHFFTADLQPLGERVSADTPLISGASMIYADGACYIITANTYTGDLVVAKYDKDWNYLGVKELRKQAHWSQGVAFDGQRFYVTYLDTSQRTAGTFFPLYPNVHLAAFDRDWNLLDDVAVTNYAVSDNKFTGRPWVILHHQRIYVSYDVDSLDPVTKQEQLDTQEAIVSIYELTQPAGRRRAAKSGTTP